MMTIEDTTTDTQTLTEAQALERYNELLDETYDLVYIGHSTFNPSDILQKLDPIAYDLGFTDYVNFLMEDGNTVEGWD